MGKIITDYWQLKEIVQKLLPRKSLLEETQKAEALIREYGRKENLKEFNFESSSFRPYGRERILPQDIIYNFLEVSIRAAHCPMPLNADLLQNASTDGCQYKCVYCYVSSYSSSLYTAFYDNWRELGLRYCNEKHFLTEMEKYMRFRNSQPFETASDIQNAFHIGVPVRLGIRSENFVPAEIKLRAAYAMLKFLKENEYPVMINTKSNLIQREEYLKVLVDNKAKAAVHMTIISSDEALLRELEPFAPTFKKRLAACKALIDAGIRVVARIEPFMCFVNDSKDKVDEYIGKLKEVGIKNITLDTYSYSASAPGLRKNFENIGWDFDRMFSVTAECQWLGSLLLTYFMRYLRSNGFSCSTFDYGSAMENDQNICCEVGDWFDGGFSHGNTIMAVRYIKSQQGKPVTWNEYERYVEANGGFLSPTWRREVQKAWNLIGTVAQVAYFPMWATGIKTVGFDDTLNTIWLWDKQFDYREELLQNLIT